MFLPQPTQPVAFTTSRDICHIKSGSERRELLPPLIVKPLFWIFVRGALLTSLEQAYKIQRPQNRVCYPQHPHQGQKCQLPSGVLREPMAHTLWLRFTRYLGALCFCFKACFRIRVAVLFRIFIPSFIPDAN